MPSWGSLGTCVDLRVFFLGLVWGCIEHLLCSLVSWMSYILCLGYLGLMRGLSLGVLRAYGGLHLHNKREGWEADDIEFHQKVIQGQA